MSDDARSRDRRRCAKCQQAAVRCVHVTQHLLNGVLPIGRTYQHACDACKATFETESVFRSIYNLAFGLASFVFGGVGTALVIAWLLDMVSGARGMPSLYQAFLGVMMPILLGVGVYLPIRSVIRNVQLLRNPVA